MVNQILDKARYPAFLKNDKFIEVLECEEAAFSPDFFTLSRLNVDAETRVSGLLLLLFDDDSGTQVRLFIIYLVLAQL
jgi:hypothetical protein